MVLLFLVHYYNVYIIKETFYDLIRQSCIKIVKFDYERIFLVHFLLTQIMVTFFHKTERAIHVL